MALPMPLPAPVTMATFPCNRCVCSVIVIPSGERLVVGASQRSLPVFSLKAPECRGAPMLAERALLGAIAKDEVSELLARLLVSLSSLAALSFSPEHLHLHSTNHVVEPAA